MWNNEHVNELSAFSKMLLIDGLDDWVRLGTLCMTLLEQEPSADEFVDRSRAAIESLLKHGLMEMGSSTGTNGVSRPWNDPDGECLDRFEESYRADQDYTSTEWALGMWLNLTPKGKALATEFEAIDPDPLGIDEDEEDREAYS